MNFQEHNGEECRHQKRVQRLLFERFIGPCYKLFHQARCVEGAGGLKDNADLIAVLVESADMVGVGLLVIAMTCVFFRMVQQITVQLLDVIFGQCDEPRAVEDRLDGLGVACHLLLVAGF